MKEEITSALGILKGKGPFIDERKLKGNVKKGNWIRY
jgi:hypothetical protein